MIKGWLKTIKDINSNFRAISESWKRALAASYFQTLLFCVRTVCHLIHNQEKIERLKKKAFPISWRGDTHQQFKGCNCCSRIEKERWTTGVQSVQLCMRIVWLIKNYKRWAAWKTIYYKSTKRTPHHRIHHNYLFVFKIILPQQQIDTSLLY